MKSNFISKENNDAKFTMEFTAEEFEQAKVKVYQESKGKFQIDGFRKGKAPRSIIEKKYGEGIFAEDAINDLIGANYGAALDEMELEVIDRPRLELTPVKEGEGFTATITVQCYPDIEVKDYKGVEIEESKMEITDEMVDEELENLRKRNARMVDVDRAVQDGDVVVLDFKGFVGDEQFEGGTADGHTLKIGSGSFIPGFEDQLIGAEKEKEVDVNVTFPEQYQAAELAGKDATFKCVVHDIKEEQLPDLDDEFVKDISELDTLEDFKADTRAKMQERAEEASNSVMRSYVVEAVADKNDFDVPDVMVDDEIDAMMQEFGQQLAQQGMDINQYMQMMGQDMAKFLEEAKPSAFKRVKNRMVMKAVAKQENIQVTDEDLQEQYEKMAKQFGLETEQVKNMLGGENETYLKADLKNQKALDIMFDAAVKVPKKEKEEKTEA